jgi:hypothetical protein
MIHGYVTDDGRLAIERFAQTDSGPMKLEEREFFDGLVKTKFSLFEIDEIRSDEGFRLSDAVDGETFEVREKTGSRTLKKYDLILAWIFPYRTHWEMLGDAIEFPRSDMERLVDLFKVVLNENIKAHPGRSENDLTNMSIPGVFRAFDDFYVKKPSTKLGNTDGHELVLSIATYEVIDRAKAVRIVSGIPGIEKEMEGEENYVWLSSDSRPDLGGGPAILGNMRIEGNKLKLECNSKERLSKLRKRLEKVAGGCIMHTVDSFEDISSLERMRKSSIGVKGSQKTNDAGQMEPAIPPEMMLEIMREYADNHLKSWIDMKIPLLGNKTPRQAVKTEKGKAAVRELLKGQLNIFERTQGCSESVVKDICLELGLDLL